MSKQVAVFYGRFLFFIFKNISKKYKPWITRKQFRRAMFQLRQFKEKDEFFAQLMNNHFNGHEYNTSFSTKCPGEENFPKQIDKSTETDRLREISSSGSEVKKLAFYTMESPDKRKLLTDQHQQTFQFSKSVHVPRKITMDGLTFSRYYLSYLKSCLVSNL